MSIGDESGTSTETEWGLSLHSALGSLQAATRAAVATITVTRMLGTVIRILRGYPLKMSASLEPASSAVIATAKNDDDDKDDQQCRVIHGSLLAELLSNVGGLAPALVLVTFATLRLLNLLFGDLRRFPVGGATGWLGTGRLAVRRGITGGEGHIDRVVDLLFLFDLLIRHPRLLLGSVGMGDFHGFLIGRVEASQP